MLILGLSAGAHDSSACLLRDGKLLHAISEERLSRKKHDGRFPKRAIGYCLDAEGISVSDIDIVAHGWCFALQGPEVAQIVSRVSEASSDDAKSAMLRFLDELNRCTHACACERGRQGDH